MSWEKSEIMVEFLKIASNNNMLGIEKNALPSPNPYQEDLKTIETKRLQPPKKNIVEEAHPVPVYVAESRGDGGLVENQLEQNKKLMQMINKHPTGSLVGRYAYTIFNLVKLANVADEVGASEVANALTDTAKKLVEQMSNTMSNMNNMADGINEELKSLLAENDRHPLEKAPTTDK